MRFFIALEIPAQSRKQLEEVQTNIKQLIPEVRLTDNGKLHLTIAFIGEQPAEITGTLTEIMKTAIKEIPPFSVTPSYLDGFPALDNFHTLWVGVKGDIDKLMVIRERVRDGLVGIGLEVDERRYIPHIAIAKINSFQAEPAMKAKLEKLMLEGNFTPISINSLKLFESIPEEGFHTHNTLAEVPLER